MTRRCWRRRVLRGKERGRQPKRHLGVFSRGSSPKKMSVHVLQGHDGTSSPTSPFPSPPQLPGISHRMMQVRARSITQQLTSQVGKNCRMSLDASITIHTHTHTHTHAAVSPRPPGCARALSTWSSTRHDIMAVDLHPSRCQPRSAEALKSP
ncbi:uncharacterized protein K489DRAFT_108644 [Dissoconium aciculare CBS 342.82]|uniref:Uncharacterized protein n=1 Tax=Dissoconium aciculare CBS 342.82 TaxID=1314786 RepID=A0A6J3MDT5_9PEZI|nr:uncharacterized protein K489DRAFT_108644 [Dissoconium aciculare CBS 342.82]KAF1826170.1 hypothetical protein K489DRAFT_108644 [Dissoconium aciculare CBS 342.82]